MKTLQHTIAESMIFLKQTQPLFPSKSKTTNNKHGKKRNPKQCSKNITRSEKKRHKVTIVFPRIILFLSWIRSVKDVSKPVLRNHKSFTQPFTASFFRRYSKRFNWWQRVWLRGKDFAWEGRRKNLRRNLIVIWKKRRWIAETYFWKSIAVNYFD